MIMEQTLYYIEIKETQKENQIAPGQCFTYGITYM